VNDRFVMAYLDAFRVSLLYDVLHQTFHQHAQTRFFLIDVVRAHDVCRVDSRHAAKLIGCACVPSVQLRPMNDHDVSSPFLH